MMRIKVKLAASIALSRNARRQSREFAANAIIASNVRMKTRAGFTLEPTLFSAE